MKIFPRLWNHVLATWLSQLVLRMKIRIGKNMRCASYSEISLWMRSKFKIREPRVCQQQSDIKPCSIACFSFQHTKICFTRPSSEKQKSAAYRCTAASTNRRLDILFVCYHVACHRFVTCRFRCAWSRKIWNSAKISLKCRCQNNNIDKFNWTSNGILAPLECWANISLKKNRKRVFLYNVKIKIKISDFQPFCSIKIINIGRWDVSNTSVKQISGNLCNECMIFYKVGLKTCHLECSR